MIQATLRYTDLLEDGQMVYKVLTANKIPIIKTKPAILLSIHPKIIVLFKDHNELSDVLYQLNDECRYEVALLKCKNVKENNYDLE